MSARANIGPTSFPKTASPAIVSMAPNARSSAEGQIPPYDDPNYDADSDSDDDPDPMQDPLAASREFLNVLVDLYLRSKVSAQDFSVLCFWAQKANMQGVGIARYAKKQTIRVATIRSIWTL